MITLELKLSSKSESAYEKLQHIVDNFVDSLRDEEPSLTAKLETCFNPNR